MRGWYNPHFTHKELKYKVIKVKSFHYFCVLPRTWFLSLFNTLLSVSKAQCALPQLQLWELSTPSRQTQNLHPHMRHTRSTQSVITSEKVCFKTCLAPHRNFVAKERIKHSFPGQNVTAFTTRLCSLSVQSLPQPTASEWDGEQGEGPGHSGGCPLHSTLHPALPLGKWFMYCEGDRLSLMYDT